jgi:hypothetical protein
MTAIPVRRRDVVSDVHFVRSKPPPILVAVVVDPADHRLAHDDAELRARNSRAHPGEAAERRVASSDDQRDVRGVDGRSVSVDSVVEGRSPTTSVFYGRQRLASGTSPDACAT